MVRGGNQINKTLLRTVAPWVVVLLFLGGCSAPPEPQEVDGDSGSPLEVDATPLIRTPVVQQGTQAGPTGTPPVILPPDPQKAAVEALAAALKIDPSEIDILSIQQVEWSDSSLGCPQPDAVYLPVITPGFELELVADSMTYSVNTDYAGTVVICDDIIPAGSGNLSDDPLVEGFIRQAASEVASITGVPSAEIVLVSAEAVDWTDSSLGCAVPDQEYLQVITYGYRIILSVGEERFEFHTDQQYLTLCPEPTQ